MRWMISVQPSCLIWEHWSWDNIPPPLSTKQKGQKAGAGAGHCLEGNRCSCFSFRNEVDIQGNILQNPSTRLYGMADFAAIPKGYQGIGSGPCTHDLFTAV